MGSKVIQNKLIKLLKEKPEIFRRWVNHINGTRILYACIKVNNYHWYPEIDCSTGDTTGIIGIELTVQEKEEIKNLAEKAINNPDVKESDINNKMVVVDYNEL